MAKDVVLFKVINRIMRSLSLNLCKIILITKKISFVLFEGCKDQIEVIVDADGSPWFKRAHVGKFLEITNIKTSTGGKGLREEMRERPAIPTVRTTYPWSGPKDQQNKTDIFLSAYGVMHVIVRSKKPKGKGLREWVMRDIKAMAPKNHILGDIVRRGFNGS